MNPRALLFDQLELLQELKQAPNVSIELDWGGNDGRNYNEEEEYGFGGFMFHFEIEVKQFRKTIPETHHQPKEYNYTDPQIINEVKDSIDYKKLS